MKKFLFTLVATMFAGVMFAGQVVPFSDEAEGNQYFYIDDTNVTANLGGSVTLDVKASLAYAMSAFQADFGLWVDGEFQSNVLPEGMTMNTAKGSQWKVTYITEDGEEEQTNVALQKGQNNTRAIGTQMDANYWDPDGDGEYESQGVVKWAAGEYSQILKATFNIPAGFEGATFAILLAPTSGNDANPEVVPVNKKNKNYYVFELSVDQAPVTVADPTIAFEQLDDVTMQVTVTAEEGATLIVNGEEVTENPYIYTVTRPDVYTAMTVEVTAKAKKGDVESNEVTGSQAFVPVQEQPTAATPEINFVETKNEYDEVTEVEVVVTNYTDYTVYVDGTPLRGEKIQATTEAAKVIKVEAENDPGYPYVKAENEATYNLNKLMATTAAPTITSSNDDATQTTTITATGDGHICIYHDDVLMAEGEGTASFTVPYSDDPEGEEYGVSATAQAEGEHVSDYATATIEVPGKPSTPPGPTQQTQTPDGAYAVTEGQHEVVVTITPANDDQTVYYRIIFTDADGNTTEGAWTEYVDPFAVTTDGHYRVEFYATEDGYLDSDPGAVEFYVTPETGINEVANGKTVAGVRYFNLAGQEMQEANGMTIVVTTYTDGTTSAVKVMK